jgi:hypothetical protein
MSPIEQEETKQSAVRMASSHLMKQSTIFVHVMMLYITTHATVTTELGKA